MLRQLPIHVGGLLVGNVRVLGTVNQQCRESAVSGDTALPRCGSDRRDRKLWRSWRDPVRRPLAATLPAADNKENSGCGCSRPPEWSAPSYQPLSGPPLWLPAAGD